MVTGVKKSHEEFICEMNEKHPTIKVLGRYVNAQTKIEVLCLVCNHKWKPKPMSLINIGSGCKQCYLKSKPKSHADYIKDVQANNANIEILSPYKSTESVVKARCIVCNHIWDSEARQLLKMKYCPVCSRTVQRRSHETYERLLKEANPTILLKGRYTTARARIDVTCSTCGYEWRPQAHEILRGSGCKICKRTGFKTNMDGWLYVYKFCGCYGFGITNNLVRRKSQHSTTLSKFDSCYEFVIAYKGNGVDISNLECRLKSNLPIYDTGVACFKTEAVEEHNGILLFREIDAFRETYRLVVERLDIP